MWASTSASGARVSHSFRVRLARAPLALHAHGRSEAAWPGHALQLALCCAGGLRCDDHTSLAPLPLPSRLSTRHTQAAHAKCSASAAVLVCWWWRSVMLRSTLTRSARALRGLDARPLRRADGRRGYAMPSDFDLLADESGAARVDGCACAPPFLAAHSRCAALQRFVPQRSRRGCNATYHVVHAARVLRPRKRRYVLALTRACTFALLRTPAGMRRASL